MKALKCLNFAAVAMLLAALCGLTQLAFGSQPSLALMCCNYVLYALMALLILYVLRVARRTP